VRRKLETEFFSGLAPHIHAYIAFKKAAGFREKAPSEKGMKTFDRYCFNNYPNATELTSEMIAAWCRKRETETNTSCAKRIGEIVGLIRYLRVRGKTDVEDPIRPKQERCTFIPHAFTETELENFFSACDELSSDPKAPPRGTRRITVPVFFRLLYSSGMRTTEARLLRRDEVDLTHGVISVRESRSCDQHYVVLHNSMLELLRRYDAVISKCNPNRTYFFPSRYDTYYSAVWVTQNFCELWGKYNTKPTNHATAYALRHNYAIENIDSWTGDGLAFDEKLHYLGKSMGHKQLESTKYYYSLTPRFADVLEVISNEDDIIPEVYNDEESY
jgi:integrase